jgi:ATP-dependent Clp protease ATP-binding subunit ClpA
VSLGHNYIGTEHILLGLTRADGSVALRILLDLGADAEAIRNELLRMLGGTPPAAKKRRPRIARFVAGWLLGAATLGAGILIGWAIWG